MDKTREASSEEELQMYHSYMRHFDKSREECMNGEEGREKM